MKKIRKILLSTILLTLLIFVTGCGQKKVTLNDYVEVSISGNYNGQANASATIDYKSIVSIIHEGEEISDLSLLAEYAALEEAISVTLDKESSLNNGDVIHITLDANEEYEKENKLNFITEDFDYTVNGLEEIKEVDMLNDIEVTYYGISPSVSVSVNVNSEHLNAGDITIEPSRNLSVGSTYKLTINKEDDYFLEKGGKTSTS